MQPFDGIAPLSIVYQIIPLRYEIVDRTTRVGLTKRRAAIHVPGSLDFAFNGGVFFVVASFDRVEFFPVKDAFGRVVVGFFVALLVNEATEFFYWLVGPVVAFYSGRDASEWRVR